TGTRFPTRILASGLSSLVLVVTRNVYGRLFNFLSPSYSVKTTCTLSEASAKRYSTGFGSSALGLSCATRLGTQATKDSAAMAKILFFFISSPLRVDFQNAFP